MSGRRAEIDRRTGELIGLSLAGKASREDECALRLLQAELSAMFDRKSRPALSRILSMRPPR